MKFKIKKRAEEALHIAPGEKLIALAGNPNVGKSTVFNALTGLRQHTGNWTGKTVVNAFGRYRFGDDRYVLADLPGTYSLLAQSKDEEAARDFICFAQADATIIVLDATTLERNLNLAVQVLEVTDRVVLCVNLMDEAARKGIRVNISKMEELLNVPVVATNAKSEVGLEELMQAVANVAGQHGENGSKGALVISQSETMEKAIEALLPAAGSRWNCLKLLESDPCMLRTMEEQGVLTLDDEKLQEALAKARTILQQAGMDESAFREQEAAACFHLCEEIAEEVVSYAQAKRPRRDNNIDRILTSKRTGIPIMLAFLALILWITIVGANYPSQWLSALLFGMEDNLHGFMDAVRAPEWLDGMLISGMYRTLSWVISVMLPPMAIFFPLFTLLEDVGYLPRIAFNLDKCFCCARAHGKQALTMCMGFGCNAVGVTGANIIDSPRERLIAILTNNFVPCNGRFPTIILVATAFVGIGCSTWLNSFAAAGVVFLSIVLGVLMTLAVSRFLSNTLLKGMPSQFALELPPYRKPKVGSILLRSVLDRTLFVLGRAISVAAPAGILIWLLANISVDGVSLLQTIAAFLDPFARVFGLDGIILLAFILGMPANEIVVPIMVMGYMAQGSLVEMESIAIYTIFAQNGWNILTAVNVILFMLMHFPCTTTLLTIRKQTKSFKWTAVAFMLPTVCGLSCCFLTTAGARVIAWLSALL